MPQMSYAEASRIVQEYTGKPLLESLECLDERIKHQTDPIIRKDVRVAYFTLMAGFAKLIL